MESKSCRVLDTPLEPVIGLAGGETRWRCMTVFAGAMRRSIRTPSFPDVQLHIVDAPLGAGPESILPVVVMDSGLALRAPRNDESFGLVST